MKLDSSDRETRLHGVQSPLTVSPVLVHSPDKTTSILPLTRGEPKQTYQYRSYSPETLVPSNPYEEYQPPEYTFTYESQSEDNIFRRFKGIAKASIKGGLYTHPRKDEVVFNLSDDVDFWWNPPWYVVNAVGEDNLKAHLSICDNPDSVSVILLEYQEGLVNHDGFTIATHDFSQGSYHSTLLETWLDVKNEDEIITLVARLLKDRIFYTDYLKS